MNNSTALQLHSCCQAFHVSVLSLFIDLRRNCLYQGGLGGSNSQVNNGGETVNTQQATNAQPSFYAQIQAKEADIHALSELTRALDKKVIFVMANYA